MMLIVDGVETDTEVLRVEDISHGPAPPGARKFALLTIYHKKYSVPDRGILKTFHT